MSRFGLLRNRHAGERCVIMCNGPSLNRMELGFLMRETVIGLNKIYLGIRQFGFYPRYLVAVNPKVIEQAASDLKRLNCVKFISSRGAHLMPEDGLTYLIKTANTPCRFCADISQGVHEGWTVTYAALQIAFFLGFEQVVIIGMDHRYDYSGGPNETRVMHGDDPNHFSPKYFGDGQLWETPDLERSEESYRIARDEYEKAGRSIVDATLDGACTVFAKQDYRKIFGVVA